MLGSSIRETRIAKGWRLKDLAEAVKVSSCLVSMIERGIHSPSEMTIRAMAKALDMDENQLLAEANIKPTDLLAIMKRNPVALISLIKGTEIEKMLVEMWVAAKNRKQ